MFQRDGDDGLRAPFSQKNSEGQRKVSSTKQGLNFSNIFINCTAIIVLEYFLY